MNKIIACNNEITDIKYNGYTISKAYACGGSLVYMKYGKLYATDSKGAVMLSVPCSTGTSIAARTLTSAETTCRDTSYCHRYTTDAIVGNCVSYIGDGAFSGFYNLKNVTLDKNVFSIGNNAFFNCSALTNINLDNITTIGTRAFGNGGNLINVSLPKTRVVGTEAFCCSDGLTTVTMPSVETIYNGAFSFSSSLTSVTIGDKVTSIQTQAFFNATSLTSLIIKATTPPTLGTDVFTGTHNSLVIYVPSGSVNAYKTASRWNNFASRIQPIP